LVSYARFQNSERQARLAALFLYSEFAALFTANLQRSFCVPGAEIAFKNQVVAVKDTISRVPASKVTDVPPLWITRQPRA
jgi:hypothetical protein